MANREGAAANRAQGGNVRTTTPGRGQRAALIGILAVLVAGSPAASAAPVAATRQLTAPVQTPQRDLASLAGGGLKPSSPLLDSRLDQLAAIAQRDGIDAARRFAADNAVRLDAAGNTEVLIHQAAQREWGRESSAVGDDPEQRIGGATFGEEALFELLEDPIRAQVARLGGSVRGRVGNLIDASVPIGALRRLDGSFGIGWVEAGPERRLSIVSEGVDVIGAGSLQASPVSYQGGDTVRVGIIDLGFKGYQGLLGTELPPSVTVRSFHPGGIEGNGEALVDQLHGTACAEIVFDVAPQAELFFANIDTLSTNDQAFDWMIEQGVDVISYSIGWYNAGPGDGTGPINDAAQRAIDAGIEVVVAAGNEARNHWQGLYTDGNGDDFHDFAPGDDTNSVFLNAGESLVVFLNWDDWFASAQDYDLFVIDQNDNLIASSTGFQTGFQNPAEALGFTAPASGTYHILINRFAATRAVNLEMFFFSPRELQFIVPAGSITIPADSPDVVAVGATFWGDDVIEFFSSQGPTTDGRVKPDLAAPDGVATASFGGVGLTFFGTSASAPHTAGAIALMKSRFGVFTLPQIREILYGRAVDQGVAGKDNQYGFGRLDVIGR
jgi:subtilisin family serine protease